MLSIGGLKSIAASPTAVVASLVGKDIVARSFESTGLSGNQAAFTSGAALFQSNAASGNIGFYLTTAGARLKFSSGGTTDYFTSNGATLITAAGGLAATTGSSNGLSWGAGGSGLTQLIENSSQETFLISGTPNSANNRGLLIGISVNMNQSGQKLLSIGDNYAVSYSEKLSIDREGKISNQAGDSTGSPGNATLDTPSGRSAFAAAATALTITNNLVSASSIVLASLQTNDATARIANIVPGSGTFTINLSAAATGTTNVGWIVFN